MISHCNFIPEEIWIRELENGIRHITLRRNFIEKTVNNNNIEETQYKFEEIDIYIADRDNIEKYVNDNFDLFFDKDLEVVKQKKIKELDSICTQIIYGGFYSNANGTNKLYDFELENQINMMGLQPKVMNGETISYYAKGEACHDYTSVQFLQLINDGATFKFNTIEKYKQLKNYVNNLTTSDEVNKINWNTVIPIV